MDSRSSSAASTDSHTDMQCRTNVKMFVTHCSEAELDFSRPQQTAAQRCCLLTRPPGGGYQHQTDENVSPKHSILGKKNNNFYLIGKKLDFFQIINLALQETTALICQSTDSESLRLKLMICVIQLMHVDTASQHPTAAEESDAMTASALISPFL